MSTWVLVCTEERTWYLVHEKAVLSIRSHPWNSTVSSGYKLIVLSVVIVELPSSDGLSCLTSSSLELVLAPSTQLLTSTWHIRAWFRLLLPPVGCFLITAIQGCPGCPLLQMKQISFRIGILKHCTTHCLPGINCFYRGGRCIDAAVGAGGSGKSRLTYLREGGGGRVGEKYHVREGAGHQLNISPC